MLELSESKIYEFEEFRLDAKSHRLFRCAGGEPVPLTPKAVELLLVLVKRGGQILTKDELLEAVWDNSFVEEANLSQTIFVLRKALGENKKEPRFILTVPNRGYQFIATVRTVAANNDRILEQSFFSVTESPIPASKSQFLPSNPKSKIQNPKLKWLALPLVLLFAFGIYWFYPSPPKPVTVREVKSIAVLPFEDLSAEQTEKYLGASLADALVNKFSGLKQITVRPTRTVAKYAANRAEDASQIGRELQVDAVLDGRIQRIGDRVRVSVQLIRTSDNATIWTENFDDNFTNFFAVQDSISQKALQSLALQLNDSEREKFNRHGTENAEAYQDYLRGRYFWNKRTADNLQKAIVQFEQATRQDPNYALAYTGLADCYQLLSEYGAATPQEAFTKAKAAAKRALEIDDQLAEAHTALAYTQAFYDWDWASAEASFKRALELNPNYATAHQWYAEFLTDMGRFDEAQAHFERALQIDPTSAITLNSVAAFYYNQRKYDETVRLAQKCVELDPNFAYCYVNLGFGYEQKGMYPQAVDAIAKAMTLFGEPPECAAEVKAAFAKNGIKGFWQKRLEQAQTRPHLKNFPAQSRAWIYARLGDKENAIAWLNRSYERRERFLITAKIAPDFDLLHQDSRFQDLLRRMNLE